jgi:hypothetical protein
MKNGRNTSFHLIRPAGEENARLREIHDGLRNRVFNALRKECCPQLFDVRPRIPKTLLPPNLKTNVIMDVTLLKGELIQRVVVTPQGFVVGSELLESGILTFDEGSVYAVRIRSGLLGRLCLKPWHCICE